MVGVTSNLSRAPVGDFARDLAECIPDRRTPSVLVDCPFDLVAVRREKRSQISYFWKIHIHGNGAYLAVAKPQRKSEGRVEVVMAASQQLRMWQKFCSDPQSYKVDEITIDCLEGT